jgi:hypothetical protein
MAAHQIKPYTLAQMLVERSDAGKALQKDLEVYCEAIFKFRPKAYPEPVEEER